MWWRGSAAFIGLAIIGGLAVGLSAALEPLLLVAPLFAVTVALFSKPWFRFAFFLVGAMLVFQTGDGITPNKLVYLVGVAVAIGLAIARLPAVLRADWGHRFKLPLLGALILAGWISLVTLVHAVTVQEISSAAWAPDALTHLLICAAVPIGIDAATSVSIRSARLFTAGFGVLAALGFAVAWIARPGFSEADQSLLASLVAVIVPVALGLTMALGGRKIRPHWLIYSIGLFLAVLVTGTRTGLVLGAIIIGLIGAASKWRVPLVKAVVAGAVASVAVLALLPLIGGQVTNATFGTDRLASAFELATGDIVVDPSGALRATAYSYGERIFADYPFFGQGVGHVFPSPVIGENGESFTLDTPWTYSAKFGVVGTLVILGSLALIIVPCVRRLGSPWMPELTTVRGALVAWLAILPFGPVTEDKGFALTVACLIMLVGSAAREATSDGQEPTSINNSVAGVATASASNAFPNFAAV